MHQKEVRAILYCKGGEELTKTFILWTHGVSVIPEFTKAYTYTENNLSIRPTGFGSIVKQKMGTENWFHFAIPSGSKLCGIPGDAWVSLEQIHLRFKINTGAVIKQITAHHNNQPNSSSPRFFDSGPLVITGQDTEYSAAINPHIKCKGPIVICARVFWEADNGEITFAGAGARFEGSE
jgi:hypothetical protein